LVVEKIRLISVGLNRINRIKQITRFNEEVKMGGKKKLSPLRRYLRKQGLQVKDFAELLGVGYVHASRVLSGQKHLSPEKASRLLRAGFPVGLVLTLLPDGYKNFTVECIKSLKKQRGILPAQKEMQNIDNFKNCR